MATSRFWDRSTGPRSHPSPMAPGRVEQANAAEADYVRWERSPPSAPRTQGLWRGRDGFWSWCGEKWHAQRTPGPRGPRYEEPQWAGSGPGYRPFVPKAPLEERRRAALASLEAVPSLGDEEVRQRWQQHIEGSWDPERAAKRIHWLISRLQMQGFNQPEEPNAFGSKIPEAPLAPPVQMAELLEMAKKDQAHQVEVQEEVEPEMEPTSDEREEKQAFDFDGWTQESHYERRRRERRKRRHGRGDERDEKPHDSVAADEFLGGLLHDRSKLGLFFGWLVGRIVFFLLALISTRLGTPIPMDSEIMQLLGAPVHWLLACVAAAWLGSLAVTRFESHSTWKIGCLAACVFTLVV